MSVTILQGDCRAVLATLPDASAHCCVTSPPYFGLRSYLRDDDPLKPLEMGLEETPEEYVAGMVAVFREVRRVLRDDGTLWLNIGDSYAGSGRGGYAGGKGTLQGSTDGQDNSRVARGSQKHAGMHEKARQAGQIARAWVPPPAGLKQKDLIGIPWMLAFALRADGWYLRQDIIWSKPNPMPESVTDRCTKAHEYLFLLSKSERYHFDGAAIAEAANYPEGAGNTQAYQIPGQREGDNANLGGGVHKIGPRETRNKRSVWTVASQPYRDAHFATFPPALIEPCILASCPVGGVVLDPFGGSGTTGMVAQKLGRGAVLIDLNPDYQPMMEKRVRTGNVGLPLEAA